MEKDMGGPDVEIPETQLAMPGEILTLHWQDGDFAFCLDSLFTGRVILRRLHTGDEVWIAGLSSSIVESHGLNQRGPYTALVAEGKNNRQGQPTVILKIKGSTSKHGMGLANLNRGVQISLKEESQDRPGSQEEPESTLGQLIPAPVFFGAK